MKQNIKTIIITTGGIIGVASSVFLLTFIVLAWTGPSSTPPLCPEGEVGCDEVLHTGTAGQSKSGGLLLNTGGAETGLIVAQGNVGIGIGAETPKARLEVKGGGFIIDPDTAEKPTCDATTRGMMWVEREGTTDEVSFCRNVNGTPSWSTILSSPIVATGGDDVYTFVGDGENGTAGQTYKVHKFTTVGEASFDVSYAPVGATVEYLVVAGGGGGGSSFGGGGGAGGLRADNNFAITAQEYNVTVGGGGAGAAAINSGYGTNGDNSIFSSIISTGGGGGGAYISALYGKSGGSGGGGGSSETSMTQAGGEGIAGQGYHGGYGYGRNGYLGGGGGGAGGLGGNAVANVKAGDGGLGFQSSISGNSAYYASGGGGASYLYSNGTTIGYASAGGGANGVGGNAQRGLNATINTGGGGGGGGYSAGGGGNGGSGIVIIRYPI